MKNMESSLDQVGVEIMGTDRREAGDHRSESVPLTSDRDSDDGKYHNVRPRSNWVQRITVGMVVLLFAMLIVVIAVISAIFDKVSHPPPPSTTVTTVYQSLGFPGFEGYNWNDVVSGAAGQTVNFYSYGGALKYNNWIDTWLSPRLLELYDIKLKRHPVTNTVDAVNRVVNEIAQGYGMKNGSVDLIWINGLNFATLKNSGIAYGPWANKVPNSANFDLNSPAIRYDFGLPTNGFELPYNEAQVVFIYNPTIIADPASISDINKLLQWVRNNPGKFTYADPGGVDGDYTGSVFIRHVFYSLVSPSYTKLLVPFDYTLYMQYAPTFFRTLRTLETFLYKDSSGGHPATHDLVDKAFGAGQIAITLSYDVGHATNMVVTKKYNWKANSTAVIVLSSGTIANTNYVAIPANSKNKLAAMVAGDFIASAQAQFSRAQPEEIGALQAYNPSSAIFTTGGWNDAFDYIDRAATTPSINDLVANRLGELSNDWVQRIQNDWDTCVKFYTDGVAAPEYCG